MVAERAGFFKTADGLRLHYRDYAPEVPLRLTVVCLHGLTRNERDFDELASAVAGLGFRVIVPSQRGRGPSDRDPMPERYRLSVYARDTLALLDHLEVSGAVFIGSSMGGVISMTCAASQPARVSAVVLNDIGGEIDPAGAARIGQQFGGTSAGAWGEAAALTRRLHGHVFPDESDPAFWLRFARRTWREAEAGRIVSDYDPAVLNAMKSADGPPAPLWPLFAALDPIPTLLIRGELSDLLSLDTVEEMRRRKPDLEFASVPRTGHTPFLTEPAAWRALSAFLMRQAAS